MTEQWRGLVGKEPTILTDLVLSLDEYLANLVDNMATKFISGGMDPFQIVTDNIGK